MSDDFVKIRSEPLGSRRLGPLLKGLVKRLGRGAISRHEVNNVESFTLLRDELDSLDPFDYVQMVTVSRAVGPSRPDREPFLKAIRSHGSGSKSRMYLALLGTESEASGPCDFRLSYGWQLEQSGDSFPHCAFEVAGKSRGVEDVDHRRELFLRILELIGLRDAIDVTVEGGKMRVSAGPGWQVTPLLAGIDGANPLGIMIRGFSAVGPVIDAGERIIERVLRRVDSAELRTHVKAKEEYNALRPELSAIARGWQVDVGGALSEASGTVLAGSPAPDAPARVPAFFWQEKEAKLWYTPMATYSGELVATQAGYCLELSTDRGSLDQLLDYASEIEGLEFTQVESELSPEPPSYAEATADGPPKRDSDPITADHASPESPWSPARQGIPVPELRGIDPACFEERGSWSSILVRSPCDEVAAALGRRRGMKRRTTDLLSESAFIRDEEWERAVCVFQLMGHEWTQLEGHASLAFIGLAESLSKKLKTTAFVHEYHDGSGTYLHLVFDRGKSIDDDEEAERVAERLGMFVACDVWSLDEGRVVCSPDWRAEDFLAAKLLFEKG